MLECMAKCKGVYQAIKFYENVNRQRKRHHQHQHPVFSSSNGGASKTSSDFSLGISSTDWTGFFPFFFFPASGTDSAALALFLPFFDCSGALTNGSACATFLIFLGTGTSSSTGFLVFLGFFTGASDLTSSLTTKAFFSFLAGTVFSGAESSFGVAFSGTFLALFFLAALPFCGGAISLISSDLLVQN
uniref:Uncharacterized protein n=1 Tax=Megaselia scalaris TaxID=36166 RepID=T1H3H9_MEGSC